MDKFGLGIMLLSLTIWLVLWLGRGQFWRADQQLDSGTEDRSTDGKDNQRLDREQWPGVGVIIPARNEAELLPLTLRSHLQQNYPGKLNIILVDDQSTDGTAQIARQIAQSQNTGKQVQIVTATPLPPDWTGKLWAMEQGIRQAQQLEPPPEYFLFTDADIEHDTANLRQLVNKAQQEALSLVSVMVRLRCIGFWEQVLIPAFVFFFQKLYPFPWVNNPSKSVAAAAGGCILIRRDALNAIGGIQCIRKALIDDCALARAVKCGTIGEPEQTVAETLPLSSHSPTSPSSQGTRKIWLGLSAKTRSLRPYPTLESIWQMVARTAFTQLNYSPGLLLGTVVGMVLIYLVPPVGAVLGAVTGNLAIAAIGISSWVLMASLYWPTLRFYQGSLWLALGLPAIATLYTLITVDSALRHWQGRGGAWKGRTYSSESTLRTDD